MDEIRVFIGFDPREAVAYYVCQQSILEHTKAKVSFHPMCGEMRDGSNTFIYERFLVPYRCGFQGTAIFIDGDMLVRADIAELAAMAPLGHAGVAVVKHDYKTKFPFKYLGYRNVDYDRKNWSSVVVWNCSYFPHRRLTPDFVAQSTGAYLHRFQWLRDDEIALLPDSWNRLVMEQPVKPEDKLLHYTIGTPCFSEYGVCEGAEEWHQTLKRAMRPIE